MKKYLIFIWVFMFFCPNIKGQALPVSYQPVNYLPSFITGGMTVRYEIGNSNSYTGTSHITDLMGNVNATLYNSPAYSSVGTNYLNLTSTSSNYLLTDNIGASDNESVFLWVYLTGNGVILSELGQNVIDDGWHNSQIELVNSTVRFSIFSSAAITSSIPTPLNMWHYIGFTYDGSTLTTYVNGDIAGTSIISRSAPTNLYFGIGARDATNMGNGGFGNFRFNAFHYYKRALSSNEVKLNYSSTLSKYQTQPFKYLKTIADYLANYRSEFKNPSFYNYTLDGNKYSILDGGFDMYDGGNITSPWLKSNTTYTSNSSYTSAAYPFAIDYSIMSSVSNPIDNDFYYISMGYANNSTDFHPLTVLGSRSSVGSPVGFQVGGNSGADGGGTLSSSLIYNGTVINGFTVYAFYRETFNATDPSHCNLFILLGHPEWGSVFGSINSFADPVSNGSNGGFLYTSGPNTANILAIQTLLSKSGGALVTAAECQTVVTNYTLRIKQALGY